MKKYIICDSKGQKTITYAKDIVDAVSYIKNDSEPTKSTVSRNERVDMNWVEKNMRWAIDATWFRIDKLKVSLKLKTKKELSLYITIHNKSDYQYVDKMYFVLYLKDHKSEDDLMQHAKELEKDLSSLVGKLYEKSVKKPKKENKIVSVFKEEVFVSPGQKFRMRDIMQIMWRRFRRDEYSSKKSKVEVFNKDKITVSLNFVQNTCSYILLFTLLSKQCKTEEEFKKYAEDLKEEIQRFSYIPERSWDPFA